jgi:hypothetical protein
MVNLPGRLMFIICVSSNRPFWLGSSQLPVPALYKFMRTELLTAFCQLRHVFPTKEEL